jgi:hypothetical protein
METAASGSASPPAAALARPAAAAVGIGVMPAVRVTSAVKAAREFRLIMRRIISPRDEGRVDPFSPNPVHRRGRQPARAVRRTIRGRDGAVRRIAWQDAPPSR